VGTCLILPLANCPQATAKYCQCNFQSGFIVLRLITNNIKMRLSSLKHAAKQALAIISSFVFNTQDNKPAVQPVFLTLKRRS
jgi:hypothetical protein